MGKDCTIKTWDHTPKAIAKKQRPDDGNHRAFALPTSITGGLSLPSAPAGLRVLVLLRDPHRLSTPFSQKGVVVILALENAFKQTLPLAILRAQYRAPKILIEHKAPTRLLETLRYLNSITNLSRSGRMHYARPKMAALLNISERRVDRNIVLLQKAGLLFRRVRTQEINGWFFGSSLQWAEQAWHALFITKPRSHDKTHRICQCFWQRYPR